MNHSMSILDIVVLTQKPVYHEDYLIINNQNIPYYVLKFFISLRNHRLLYKINLRDDLNNMDPLSFRTFIEWLKYDQYNGFNQLNINQINQLYKLFEIIEQNDVISYLNQLSTSQYTQKSNISSFKNEVTINQQLESFVQKLLNRDVQNTFTSCYITWNNNYISFAHKSVMNYMAPSLINSNLAYMNGNEILILNLSGYNFSKEEIICYMLYLYTNTNNIPCSDKVKQLIHQGFQS